MLLADPAETSETVRSVVCWNVIFEGPNWLYVAGHADDRTLGVLDPETRSALEESAHWATPDIIAQASAKNVVTYRELVNGWVVGIMPHNTPLATHRPKN